MCYLVQNHISIMSIYRNSVWFAKGLREYTQNGYLSAAKHFVSGDLDVDCSGKSFMITGSNSGIGKQTALEIAKRGGTVHMVCRNPKTAEEARQEIVKESSTQDGNVQLHVLDMSDPKGVHAFASKFCKDHQDAGLDVLINNAGCMSDPRSLTEDGLEKNFATNTLGPHVLTEALIPLLTKRPDARVILVSSGGMLVHKLDANDLQYENKSFDATLVYAQNKRQQVVMTEQYAKKYPNIVFTSMHPGWADTPAVRTSMPSFYNMMKNKLRTVEQGADTILWLAITANPEAGIKNSGQFFQDRKAVAKHLPLAWSQSKPEDDAFLMKQLDDFYVKFQPKSTE